MNTQYILNIDQFFDCSGVVQTSNRGTFSASDILDLSNNNYFFKGTSWTSCSSIVTSQ
jgi:hypothetical protein